MSYYLAIEEVSYIEHLLPDALLADIEDTTFRMMSWSAELGELTLHVWKDNTEEAGIARFRGVSFVCLPRNFKVRELVSGGFDLLPAELHAAAPAPGEAVVVFQPTWGRPHFVVCESVEYEEFR